MSVDTTSLKARIGKVTVDRQTDPKTWTVANCGVKATVTINGSYLTGSTPLSQKAEKISNAKISTEDLNKPSWEFSFQLGRTRSGNSKRPTEPAAEEPLKSTRT